MHNNTPTEIVDPEPVAAEETAQYEEMIQKSIQAQKLIRAGRSPKKVVQALDLPTEMLHSIVELQRELIGNVSRRSYTTPSISDVRRKNKRKAQRSARKVSRTK